MSNFLAGVVRRGAGLASPVAVRPALAPQQLPLQMPLTAAMSPASMGPIAEGETRPRAWENMPRENAMRDTTAATGILPGAISIPEKDSPVMPAAGLISSTPARLDHDPPVAVSATRIITHREESSRMVQPSSPVTILPATESIRADRPSAIRSETSTPPTSTPAAPARPEAYSKDYDKKQQAIMLPSPIVNPPAASPSHAAADKRQAEPRSIQVKIGKVEIRSTQPPPVAPSVRPPARGGFDDLTLTRNYLDRGTH